MASLMRQSLALPAREVNGAMDDHVTPAHLVATDRLAALGAVTRGVVHEINNPLTTVLTNLNFVAESLAELASGETFDRERLQELVEAVGDVRNGADRVRAIVRDLHGLATDLPRALVNPNRVLERAVRVAAYDLRLRGRLELWLAPGLPEVEAEEGALGQLFLGLLLNAAQAVPPNAAGANSFRVVSRLDAQGGVVVEIRDSGSGLPEHLGERVFDPDTTTKPPGTGTGLGLHACRTITASMGASLELLSEGGPGTVARVTFGVGSHQTAGPAREKRGRVLVVDDDRTIGATVARVLRAHEVELLTSARQALERLAAGERYDVILCDLMMPDMTGIELHEALSLRAPDALSHLVFLSGGAFTEAASAFVARVSNPLLEKPFDPAELRAFVAARVARAQG